MGKAIRNHISRNGKQTYCGIAIHDQLPMAIRGEVFFMNPNTTDVVKLDCMCRNCVSLMAKANPIYRKYLETVRYNESIMNYDSKLPKTKRAMKLYCAKRRLNWNNKNTKPTAKLISPTPIADPVIELTEVVNSPAPTMVSVKQSDINAVGKQLDTIIETVKADLAKPTIANPMGKSQKGINRELRKAGLLPNEFKKAPKDLMRIQDDQPFAIVRGFGNNWMVITEANCQSNTNGTHVKPLSGWVPIELARKIYNQHMIERLY